MTKPAPSKCVRCDGDMQEGYLVDRNGGWYEPTKWFEGELKLGRLGGVAKSEHKPVIVTTYRCVQCGYLESYARES
jgi:hypothetical protein